MSAAKKFVASQVAATGAAPDIRMLMRENKGLKERLLRGKGLEDVIIETVREVLKDPAPVPELARRIPYTRGKKVDAGDLGDEIAVLHVSDTQIGKRTRTYDHVVAAERLMKLAEKTNLITEMRRSVAAIRECRVYLGGDMVEGENVFGSQAHHITLPLIDQATNHGPAMIDGMLRALLTSFDRVHVVGVVGNHGRSGPAKGTQNEVTNWDRVLYRVLRLRLADCKRITWDIPDTWYAVDRVFDWGNLVVHGDQIRGGFAGFPWYGTAKKAWGWIDAIPSHWDYLWFGHFHTYASATLNYRTFLANGSTESDNEYAQEQMAAAGWASQRLAFFSATHGLVSDQQLFLGERQCALRRGRAKK